MSRPACAPGGMTRQPSASPRGSSADLRRAIATGSLRCRPANRAAGLARLLAAFDLLARAALQRAMLVLVHDLLDFLLLTCGRHIRSPFSVKITTRLDAGRGARSSHRPEPLPFPR